MPRELLHWRILDEAAAALDAKNCAAVRECLSHRRAAAYVGAIVHDAPYYSRFGKDYELIALTNGLHGSGGEDTFEPIRNLGARICGESDPIKREILWAFLLGYVSHCVADASFHPMVFYFSGNYEDPDQLKRNRAETLHRRFETYLDHCLGRRRECLGNGSLFGVLRELGADQNSILDLLSEVFHQPGVDATRWRSALLLMARALNAFSKTPVGMVVSFVNYLVSGKLSALDALFSYGRNRDVAFFASPVSYQNPSSGESISKSVEDLLDTAVARTAELFSHFEPLVSGASKDASSVFEGLRGPSLTTGLRETKAPLYKHFSSTIPDFLQDRLPQ